MAEPLNLIQMIREHLRDERINSPEEVSAEIDLMTNTELVEVISFVLEPMLAGRREEWPASATRSEEPSTPPRG